MKIRVLVIDDAAFMRDIVKKGVRSCFPGFRIDEAQNGRQAMGMLQKESYDLVLCDWEMPEMNGAELLEWIRNNEETSRIPFIMVTSRGDREHVAKAIALKANNYIVKPFTSEKLGNVVTQVLMRARGISAEQLRDGSIAAAQQQHAVGLSGAIPVTARIGAGMVRGEEAAPRQQRSPTVVRPTEKILLSLRSADTTTPCLVKELSSERLIGVIRRGSNLPTILEMVVLDIESGGEIARLNGYVHTLQTRDDSAESEFINITVRLVDQDDPDKQRFLTQYMVTLQP
jgi:CheY-like chemotaxis protein